MMMIGRTRALAIALGCIAIFFATFRLTESPPVWYDEGWYIQTAGNVAATGIDGIQLAPGYIEHVPYLTVGYPLIYPLAAWSVVFGPHVLSARALMVVFVLALLFVSWSVARRLWGDWMATCVLALIATFPPLYGNGKSVLGEVPGMFYLILFLLLFNLARNSISRKVSLYACAGLAAGLSMATKPVFLVLLPALALGVFVQWKRGQMPLRAMGVGLAGLILPIMVWSIVQFQPFPTADMFAFYANPYAESSLMQVLINNVSRLWTDPSILFTIFILGAWTIALVMRVCHRGERQMIVPEEVISYAFSLLIFLAFLRIGSVYRYLFPTQILCLMFLVPSVWRIMLILPPAARSPVMQKWFLVVGVASIFILRIYQLGFDSWVAESYRNHRTAFWQGYFAATPTDDTYYFYDTPEVVPFMRSRNYYQSLLTPAGRPTGIAQHEVLRAGIPDIVIIDTETYANTDKSLLGMYVPRSTAYKYSILERVR